MMSYRSPHRLGCLLWAALAGFFSNGSAFAGDCWVDIYDKPDFQGSHVRIEGPKDLPSLKNLNGDDWHNRIESLTVGSKAEVVAFKREKFNEEHEGPVYHQDAIQAWGKKEMPAYHELEITFGPDTKKHHLGELNFHQNINSLKIRCR